MRKVFLDNLPKRGKQIDWKNSVGYKVKFIYDNIESEIEILDCDSKTRKIRFLYNKVEYFISADNFKKCAFTFILKLRTKDYKFKVGEIVETNTGKIEILECIRIKTDKYAQKGYKYKCLIDNNMDNICECSLVSGAGCGVCTGQKVLKGYNDIWTTHPHIAKLLENHEKGCEITAHSNKKEYFICPICGNRKNVIVNNVTKQGLGCSCGDGVSYPNKFMFNVLSQLNIEFQNEKTFKWSKNIKHYNSKLCGSKRYDFYIPSRNCILEVQGLQHFKQSFVNYETARMVEEEQINDEIKKEVALKNGIKNYIIIDAKKSNMEYIKKNILNSDLSMLINLNNIDWIKCHEFACDSLVKKVCDLWNNGMQNSKLIGNELKLTKCTIIKYLKQGEILNWCDYNAREQLKKTYIKNGKLRSRKVICLNTGDIFNSQTDAGKKYKAHNICLCCQGKKSSSGKHPITGEPLKWMYYEDYLQQQEEQQLKESM